MTWPLTRIAAPLALGLIAAAASAQESEAANEADDPQAAAQATPVIVEADRDTPEPRAQLGSRIPQAPRFTDLAIATSTGIAGLTPGAGLEPFHGANRVSKRITSTCVSDHEAIGERAACLLLNARSALADGEIEAAADIYRFRVSAEGFAGFFDRIAELEGFALPAYLSSHPVTEERAMQARDFAGEQADTTPILTDAEWSDLQGICDSVDDHNGD